MSIEKHFRPMETWTAAEHEEWERTCRGLQRLGEMGDPRRLGKPGRRRPDIHAEPEKTIVGRDRIAGRPAMTKPPRPQEKQADFFTPPKSDPAKAAADTSAAQFK